VVPSVVVSVRTCAFLSLSGEASVLRAGPLQLTCETQKRQLLIISSMFGRNRQPPDALSVIGVHSDVAVIHPGVLPAGVVDSHTFR
jgi:hypothetical protein